MFEVVLYELHIALEIEETVDNKAVLQKRCSKKNTTPYSYKLLVYLRKIIVQNEIFPKFQNSSTFFFAIQQDNSDLVGVCSRVQNSSTFV